MPNVPIPSRNVKYVRSKLSSLCVVQVGEEPGRQGVAPVLQMRGDVLAGVHPEVSLDGLEGGFVTVILVCTVPTLRSDYSRISIHRKLY